MAKMRRNLLCILKQSLDAVTNNKSNIDLRLNGQLLSLWKYIFYNGVVAFLPACVSHPDFCDSYYQAVICKNPFFVTS